MPTYRHKSVARYQVIGGTTEHPRKFQFENFLLRLKTDADDDAFRAAIKGFPARELRQIVTVDEEAERRLEKPLSRSIRGFADSASNPSAVKGGEGLRTIGQDQGLIGGQGAGQGDQGQTENPQAENPNPADGQGGPNVPQTSTPAPGNPFGSLLKQPQK